MSGDTKAHTQVRSKKEKDSSMAQPHEAPNRRSTIGTPPSTPRWVKVLGIVLIVLVALVVILHLTGTSPGGPHSHTMPSSVIEQRVQPL